MGIPTRHCTLLYPHVGAGAPRLEVEKVELSRWSERQNPLKGILKVAFTDSPESNPRFASSKRVDGPSVWAYNARRCVL